jgi:hypothetical protein
VCSAARRVRVALLADAELTKPAAALLAARAQTTGGAEAAKTFDRSRPALVLQVSRCRTWSMGPRTRGIARRFDPSMRPRLNLSLEPHAD